MKNYDDIINLPHHVSKNHPQMSRYNRAAQFAPFSALTGYEESINEAGRYVTNKIELDDSNKEEINFKLNITKVYKFPFENKKPFAPAHVVF